MSRSVNILVFLLINRMRGKSNLTQLNATAKHCVLYLVICLKADYEIIIL